MKKISLDDYNNYISSVDVKFYFSIVFEDMSYFSVADDHFIIDDRKGNIVAKIDDFASSEFINFVYEPFIKSLKDKTLVEGEVLDEMFNYTYSNTIRASKDNIYVMLHGGSKELFTTKFDDEVIDRLNKKAYGFFASVDNSVDREVFGKIKQEIKQFILDYGIDK